MSNDNAIVQLFAENFMKLEKKQKCEQHYPESGVRRRLEVDF